MPDSSTIETTRLTDLWDRTESTTGELDLLRYRSNLLGADPRITNFGGGNTSAKFELPDALSGEPTRVLAVKGSGGDLRSIAVSGFAVLYLDKLEALIPRYRGEAHEDEMVGRYSLCAFGENRVAASIDTPLHALLPFPHVDHLHPDWGIALAASANGARKLAEFNERYGRRIVWLPWQRPGFELALMLRRAVEEHPDCDGLVLGSHGLFTWGASSRECYMNSVRTIDQMGEFVEEHAGRSDRPLFGGTVVRATIDRRAIAAAVLPMLRGAVSSARRVIGHYDDSDDVLAFANAAWAPELCTMGTSCPDHFLRTRICPMFVPWDPAGEGLSELKASIQEQLGRYRTEYVAYYQSHADQQSPPLRGSDPSVVVVPGLGVFGFGKNKREARVTTEFFVNAVHVMAGANALEGPGEDDVLPQARHRKQAADFSSFHNYVALPRSEAFRIEYWVLEEAKLKRQPPERAFSRKIALVVGGGSGIGKETAVRLAELGAHVVVADRDLSSAEATATEAGRHASPEMISACALDLTSRESVANALRAVTVQFGGLDIVINTAAVFPTPEPGEEPEASWGGALHLNVTGNYVLAEEAARILADQRLPASIVLTSSANAVVPKRGSEAYDVSKAAISHLIRELAVGLGPLVRVNGIAPATVVEGSSMFPRNRVTASLQKYGIEFDESEQTESLRATLAQFYAGRTITHAPVLPADCASAICWLAGDESAKTTGHVIPVDGGLPEAFLR